MIIVSGDSMKNAGIDHGDRLHVYADVPYPTEISISGRSPFFNVLDL